MCSAEYNFTQFYSILRNWKHSSLVNTFQVKSIDENVTHETTFKLYLSQSYERKTTFVNLQIASDNGVKVNINAFKKDIDTSQNDEFLWKR